MTQTTKPRIPHYDRPQLPGNLAHMNPVDMQNAIFEFNQAIAAWAKNRGIQPKVVGSKICKHGHRMIPENTYSRRVKRKHGIIWEKYCGKCHRLKAKETARKKRQAAKDAKEAIKTTFGKLI